MQGIEEIGEVELKPVFTSPQTIST